MKAVIPAAGLGVRFLPYTRSQPKEMLPVVDKPAIQYVVEEAVESGIHELLIVTARGKRAIEDHFDRNIELEQHASNLKDNSNRAEIDHLLDLAVILYVRQREHRGLGDAVLISEKYIGSEPFSVLLGDDVTFGQPPCQKALLETHKRKGASVLAVQKVPRASLGRYGMVVGDEEEAGVYRVRDIIEKPAPAEATSDLATLGRYVLTPPIFEILRRTDPDKRGEIQLTDAIRKLLGKEDVFAYLFPGRRYDIGDKIGWLRANIELALDRDEMKGQVAEMLSQIVARRGS